MSIITTSAHCTALAVSITFSPAFGCLLDRWASRAQADHDLHARIAQIVGVGKSLAAVADHGDLPAPYPLRLDVLFVEDFMPWPPLQRMVHTRVKKSTIRTIAVFGGGRPEARAGSVLQYRDLHPAVLSPSLLRGVVPQGDAAPIPRAVTCSALPRADGEKKVRRGPRALVGELLVVLFRVAGRARGEARDRDVPVRVFLQDLGDAVEAFPAPPGEGCPSSGGSSRSPG